MAYDRYDLKYHLTPSGWVTQNDPPDDCVETWDMHAEQASGWSRERKAWSCAWASPKWTREQRDEMRKPVSLRPLTVEQALGDMLKVKPPPEKPRRGGKKVAFRNANKQEG